jgi:cell division septum initiation protein DivIVA
MCRRGCRGKLRDAKGDPGPTGGRVDSVFELLDRLEALLSRAGTVPWTDKRIVDEREVRSLLEMLRAKLPAELAEAHRLRVAAEEVLQRAQEQARRMVTQAQEELAQRVDEHEVVRHARARAEEILERARQEAEETRRGADEYARQVLEDLEQGVMRVLLSIRKGKELLDRGREG